MRNPAPAIVGPDVSEPPVARLPTAWSMNSDVRATPDDSAVSEEKPIVAGVPAIDPLNSTRGLSMRTSSRPPAPAHTFGRPACAALEPTTPFWVIRMLFWPTWSPVVLTSSVPLKSAVDEGSRKSVPPPTLESEPVPDRGPLST